MWRDFDERWFSPTGRDNKVVVSPDGKSVAFISDKSGWIHIYVTPTNATSANGQAKQLTSGGFLAGLGSWSTDSKKIAYHRTVAGNQMERFIDVIDVATGKIEQIVTTHGVNYDPSFSPDGSNLVFHRTNIENSLDVYTVPARPGAQFTRLSDSMPAGLNKTDLTPPVAVSFPSRLDKKPVPATLMVSKNIDRSRKNPALVWIHGSGSDQNFLGWHPGSYRMYYSAVRSTSRSRATSLSRRTTVGVPATARLVHRCVHGRWASTTRPMSLASADYLKTLSYVDPDRIGVWGSATAAISRCRR